MAAASTYFYANNLKHCNNFRRIAGQVQYFIKCNYSESPIQVGKKKEQQTDDDLEFRKLDLLPKQEQRQFRERTKPNLLPPRYKKMPIDQDWPSVWPAAQSFRPSVVPLPLRQGLNKSGPPPGKFGNLELMKIPNFLHLTPPAIKRHCQAIKQFCTPWPEGLETDEACAKHFPVQVIRTDYCHSGPTIRDIRARIVTVQIKLSDWKLDKHARDKLLRLVGDRYDEKTDTLSIVTDRCPTKKQNYDYSMYVLTALYHESWRTEPWEFEKEEVDMELFVWDDSVSKKIIVNTLTQIRKCPEEAVLRDQSVQQHAQVVTSLHNRGEDMQAVLNYKDSVLRLLGMDGGQPQSTSPPAPHDNEVERVQASQSS